MRRAPDCSLSMLKNGYFSLEPLNPGCHALTGLAGNLKKGYAGIERFDALAEISQIEVKIRLQIDLIEQQHIQVAVHVRIFVGLVIPLWQAGDDQVKVGAKLESGRADEVAHILDDEQVDRVQGQLCQSGLDHAGVQVALPTGIDLHHWDAVGLHFIRVNGHRGGIALNNTNAYSWRKRLNGLENETGLTRAGGSHNINSKNAILTQQLMVFGSDLVVGVEDVLDNLNFGHSDLLLLDFNAFQAEFVSGKDLDVHAMAMRAGHQFALQFVFTVAIQTE